MDASQTLDLALPQTPPSSYDCRVTLKTTKKSLKLNITSLVLAENRDELFILDGDSALGSQVLVPALTSNIDASK